MATEYSFYQNLNAFSQSLVYINYNVKLLTY
ncbi:hypothetical protein C21_04130 [Arenibacter sp. NBRC 103722]|nr:hypothetical protein C21_04130 [Arenibacter sp. NBRC 103722]